MTEYKQNENGFKGENKTRAKLCDDFWLLKRSVDADGVDLIVQSQKNSQSELIKSRECINNFGYIQAKYFEGNNQVKIARHYVDGEDEKYRKGFFAYLHTNDSKGEQADYFFTSEEIQNEWYLNKSEEHYCFSLTNHRSYNAFKNRKRNEVKELIEHGMKNLTFSIESLVSSKFLSLHSNVRSSYLPCGHYILTRVHECAIVLYKDDNNTMPLDPRKDSFVYSGSFEWGYGGTAPRFLAASILTHFFCGKKPLQSEIERLVEYLLSRLERFNKEDHIISKDMIIKALLCIPYNSKINESHGLIWEMYQEGIKKYQNYFISFDEITYSSNEKSSGSDSSLALTDSTKAIS